MTEAKARPFLMFEGQASDAMDFYMSLFPDGRLIEVERYGADEAGSPGTIKKALFFVAGQEVLCTDSFVKHDFSFTPAFSFFVESSSEDEIRRLVLALGEGRRELMPLADYGFSRLFAWVNDRFGVSWQLCLS